MSILARSGSAVPGISGWLSDLGRGIQKSVIDPLKEGVTSAGTVVQRTVLDPVKEVLQDTGASIQKGLDSAGDALQDFERSNRELFQRLAPCVVGLGITYVTGGATASLATAICVPALIPGGAPEMLPMDDPRAQEYAATHDVLVEPGDPGLFGIPGLPAPSRSNVVLYAAAGLGLLLLLLGGNGGRKS